MLSDARRTVTAKELTAKELARLTGYSRRAAEYWKAGKVRPGPVARRILASLGIKEDRW
jgi:transcriptional regulator with XRE-family HTH domain